MWSDTEVIIADTVVFGMVFEVGAILAIFLTYLEKSLYDAGHRRIIE